jgi:cytochrome c oxidase subunit 1
VVDAGNAVAAVVMLLIGGITALAVVLTRWPAVHLLPADQFYQLLTLHGINMLIFWIIFFEIAVLYFCCSTLLRVRLATPRLGWLAFALMLAGAIVNNLSVLSGNSSGMVMGTEQINIIIHNTIYVPGHFHATVVLGTTLAFDEGSGLEVNRVPGEIHAHISAHFAL